MRVLAIAVLASCGRIGFDASALADGAIIDTMNDASDATAANCTTYTFDTLPLPPGLIEYSTGGIAVNGRLECFVPGPPGASCGVQSSPNVSFHNRSTAIHIIQITDDPTAVNGPGWHGPGGSVHFFVTQTQIQLTDGVSTVSDVYNPAAHAWVRLREQPGTIFGEVSPDGVAWTNFGSINSFDLTSAFLDMGSDNTGAPIQPDIGIFDDLVICPPL